MFAFDDALVARPSVTYAATPIPLTETQYHYRDLLCAAYLQPEDPNHHDALTMFRRQRPTPILDTADKAQRQAIMSHLAVDVACLKRLAGAAAVRDLFMQCTTEMFHTADQDGHSPALPVSNSPQDRLIAHCRQMVCAGVRDVIRYDWPATEPKMPQP